MCSAHHDPSESLVPVSDISREKRGPCSATTGSATIQSQHLIPFSSAADRENLRGIRGENVKGWFIFTLFNYQNHSRVVVAAAEKLKLRTDVSREMVKN